MALCYKVNIITEPGLNRFLDLLDANLIYGH